MKLIPFTPAHLQEDRPDVVAKQKDRDDWRRCSNAEFDASVLRRERAHHIAKLRNRGDYNEAAAMERDDSAYFLVGHVVCELCGHATDGESVCERCGAHFSLVSNEWRRWQ